MTQKTENRKHGNKVLHFLCTPIRWFEKYDNGYFNTNLMIYIILFLSFGFVLTTCFTFPYFEVYVCIFASIAIIIWKAIKYFSLNIRNIVTNFKVKKINLSACSYYDKYVRKNILYIILPCVILFIFGGGGISMVNAVSHNLLFLWVMILFTVVVYISIIGYVEYFLLAIFIYKLSSEESIFEDLPHSIDECVPADIDWIQKITRLTHWYQIVFFTVGSLYIIAFGAVCLLPDFKANRDSAAFYILWAVIIVAIVLTFPIVSALEHTWIKKIVKKLKDSYIFDIHKEVDQIIRSSKIGKMSKMQVQLWENVYALKIIESRDYPTVSAFSKIYGICLSVFNFGATIFTLIGGIPTVLNVLHQIL